MNNCVSKIEARRLLTKFFMENNCLREYIACYRQQHENASGFTPCNVISNVVNTLHKNGTSIGSTLESIKVSFSWNRCEDIMCSMHNVDKDENPHYAFNYWNLLSKKLYKYCYVGVSR